MNLGIINLNDTIVNCYCPANLPKLKIDNKIRLKFLEKTEGYLSG